METRTNTTCAMSTISHETQRIFESITSAHFKRPECQRENEFELIEAWATIRTASYFTQKFSMPSALNLWAALEQMVKASSPEFYRAYIK